MAKMRKPVCLDTGERFTITLEPLRDQGDIPRRCISAYGEYVVVLCTVSAEGAALLTASMEQDVCVLDVDTGTRRKFVALDWFNTRALCDYLVAQVYGHEEAKGLTLEGKPR